MRSLFALVVQCRVSEKFLREHVAFDQLFADRIYLFKSITFCQKSLQAAFLPCSLLCLLFRYLRKFHYYYPQISLGGICLIHLHAVVWKPACYVKGITFYCFNETLDSTIASIYSCVICIATYFSIFHKHEEIIEVYVKPERPQDQALWYTYHCFPPCAEGPIHLYPLLPLIEMAMDQPQCTHTETIST